MYKKVVMPVENPYYLSKSFITLLVPAVQILSGIKHKGFTCLYVTELAICETHNMISKDNKQLQRKQILKILGQSFF